MITSKISVTAVVIRPVVTWFAAAGRETAFHATPDWATLQLDRVVLAAQTVWFQRRMEGTVLWQCDVPALTAQNMARAMIERLRARDCDVTETGLATGWFTVRHAGWPDVHLGLSPLIQQGRTSIGELTGDPCTLAMRLARYADVSGAAWRGTGGLSGCAAIRSIHEANRRTGVPLWKWQNPPSDVVGTSFELKPKHGRPLSEYERNRRYVHQFDIRAMYLAAAGVAMVGWSAPEHTGPREFDPGRAGYWQVRRHDELAVPATVCRYPVKGEPLTWLSTPVMTYLREQGLQLEAFDSWTCDRTGRYLRPWTERLTAARDALNAKDDVDKGVLAAVKDTYARTVGMMQRPTSRIYRPDWRDCVVDTARINLIRKLNSAVEPVRFNVDSVWVATDHEAQQIGEWLGTRYDIHDVEVDQVGKFKHVDTLTVGQYLEKFERETARA